MLRLVEPGLRRAEDYEDFCAAPDHAFLTGGTYTFYNLGRVCGWRVWGRPSIDDAQRVAGCIATAYAPGAPRYVSLVDLRDIERIDSESFEVFLAFTQSIRERMATQLKQQAVVRPSGLMGALVTGFYALLQPRHQIRVFDSMPAALAWMQPVDPSALGVIARAFDASESQGLAAGVRLWLKGHLNNPEPAAAARSLGVSKRTLQRKLGVEATSFGALVKSARVEAAQQLLMTSHLKVSAVAHEVGFSSSQQMATCFKDVTGMSPSDYQARFRNGVAVANTR